MRVSPNRMNWKKKKEKKRKKEKNEKKNNKNNKTTQRENLFKTNVQITTYECQIAKPVHFYMKNAKPSKEDVHLLPSIRPHQRKWIKNELKVQSFIHKKELKVLFIHSFNLRKAGRARRERWEGA